MVALHLRGKAYAWWKFESLHFKNANDLSYASFTKALVIRFNRKISEAHVMKEDELKTQPLHVMWGKLHPLQKTMVEGSNAVKSRFDLAPQVEEEGAISPTRGVLVAWKENP